MRTLARPLAAGAVVAAALLATPAQAAPPAAGCDPVTACLVSDPFWLFRPCGPIVKCP